MNFKEIFYGAMLNEMAFKKRVMEDKIRNLENQINEHLIKFLRYKDNINEDKHINDIMTWLYTIDGYDWQKPKRKFSKELYFKLLFKEPITDASNIDYILGKEKRTLKKYSTLPRKRDVQETLRLMENLHLKIAELLHENRVYDFEYELKRLKG